MSLQGTIETFGLSEILQLVSQQGKTGTLEIRTDQGLARLRFLEGKLVEAWPDHRTPSELIGALLVRAGLVTEAQLQRALEEQVETLKPLGDLLLRMGALRAADFQEVLCLQHRETMYKLLRLKRGSFRFVTEPVEVDEAVGTPMEVGALLMEGFRQIDEWPKALERVPSEKLVYERLGGEESGDLAEDEAAVLALVDGANPVRVVVDRARLGEFAGWEALARLAERGVVAPVGRGRPAASRPRRPGKRLAVADLLAALLLLVLTAGLLLSQRGGFEAAQDLGRVVAEARREAAALQDRARAWNEREPQSWPPLPRLP